MPIELIGGFSAFDQQQFTGTDPYAAKQATLAQSSQESAPMDKQTFGAAVVSKTLDYMNSGQGHDNGMAQSYDFQKSVLGGHADAIASGALANIKV
ncbi:MAG: hypothetical protein CVU73_01530 [Deltaproteobacteria bacterium HGW-Deltaproteobacteria-8]|nr:MAG: hypothetical protein CVU73_01530 [Deltaproteobacteria bacterium HGW-Deltaproteobacteria-8]